jgi:tRNA 5-methylaminomethyl-2-thiouridine biosynthesis bifunctional protein
MAILKHENAAHVEWTDDGTPISKAFGDIYFHRSQGVAESQYVFLDGCLLPSRWANRDHFTIGECGFGFGLNFALIAALWREWDRPLNLLYVAFELAPVALCDIERVAERFAKSNDVFAPWIHRFQKMQWPGTADHFTAKWSLNNRALELHVIFGDANQTLSRWPGHADAWFFDGFSPAKNPALWTQHLLSLAYEKSNHGACFATYTAAGWVRRNFIQAGFLVEKKPGFGAKRDMLVGRKL